MKEQGGRKYRSSKERQQLLRQFELSGLSQAEFCEEHGIHKNTFSNWVRRAGIKRQSFKEVEVPTPTAPPAVLPVEVSLPGGVQVRIMVPDAAGAVNLIRELRRC